MSQLTFLSEEPPVSPLVSPDSAKDWMIRVATSRSSFLDLLTDSGLAGCFGRMCPAYCQVYPTTRPIHVRRKTRWIWNATDRKWKSATSTIQKRYTPSMPSWARLGNSGMGSPTEFWTLSSSEWNHTLGPYPSDDGVCSLSDILETGAERKGKGMNDQTAWKTLTVYQPWASMIALGPKTVETRNHTAFAWLAGQRLAIHAGKRYDRWSFEYLVGGGFNPLQSLLMETVVPRGAVVAVCRVTAASWLVPADEVRACCPIHAMFGLFLEDVRGLIEPVPVRGKQGVWSWTPPAGWSVETHTRPVHPSVANGAENGDGIRNSKL